MSEEAEQQGPPLSKEDKAFIEGASNVSQIPASQHNIHEFLYNIVVEPDTTRLGFLDEIELGAPKLPLRTHKELEVFCEDVADMEYFGKYFNRLGQVLTATSLSKHAKLIELAVVQRREVADVTKKPRVENKSWFKKKTPEENIQ